MYNWSATFASTGTDVAGGRDVPLAGGNAATRGVGGGPAGGGGGRVGGGGGTAGVGGKASVVEAAGGAGSVFAGSSSGLG